MAPILSKALVPILATLGLMALRPESSADRHDSRSPNSTQPTAPSMTWGTVPVVQPDSPLVASDNTVLTIYVSFSPTDGIPGRTEMRKQGSNWAEMLKRSEMWFETLNTTTGYAAWLWKEEPSRGGYAYGFHDFELRDGGDLVFVNSSAQSQPPGSFIGASSDSGAPKMTLEAGWSSAFTDVSLHN